MSIREHTCVSALCDGCGDEPWEDGIPHFDSRDDAIAQLRAYGWLVTDDRLLCAGCSRKADCDRTSHQYEQWEDREYLGVPYRVRRCEHCHDYDHDPPYDELLAQRHVALAVNQVFETAEEAP